MSGRENRALNTNRNKMEQAKTSNFSLGQLLASCFLKFMIRIEYFSFSSFSHAGDDVLWVAELIFIKSASAAVSTLTFYGNIIPLCAPLRMQQGVDSTRKKKRKECEAAVDTVGLAASDNKTIDGGSSKQPCVT